MAPAVMASLSTGAAGRTGHSADYGWEPVYDHWRSGSAQESAVRAGPLRDSTAAGVE